MQEPRETLKIITYGHPTLRVKCEPITEFDDSVRELAETMHATMDEASGVGLAASQVDRRIRLLVVGLPQEESEEVLRLSIANPEILESRGSWEYEEGCLSIPDVRDQVTRPEWMRLKYQDLHGRHHTIEVDGLLGRVLQHEIDHLNGILFIDHLSVVRRTLHGAKLRKLMRENEIERSDSN